MSPRNRGFTIAGLFFVVFLVPLVAGNSCEDTGFHPEKKGKYLKHHVIDAMTTETASLCRIMCYLQESCKSFNYQPSNGSCDLSDSDETEHPYDLVLNPEHVYVSRKNPCENNPCPRHRVCKPNLMNGSHSCPCSRGYEGPNCNEDINECETGKHDCPSDFKCINTEGSFTCEKLFGGENVSSVAGGLENSTILTNYGNSSYLDVLSGFLAPVLQNPSTSRWVRCWHAATDGWDVTKTFHPQCDGKGPTVTIVRVGTYVFGGYTDVSWHSRSYRTYFWRSKSFLFSLFNIHGYEPIKLRNTRFWIHFGYRSSGPSFGYDLEVFRSGNAYSRCYSYECPPRCSVQHYCSFFTDKSSFQVDDVEAFFRQVKD